MIWPGLVLDLWFSIAAANAALASLAPHIQVRSLHGQPYGAQKMPLPEAHHGGDRALLRTIISRGFCLIGSGL